MPSLTYIAVLVLAALGVDNAPEVAEAVTIVVLAVIALYGRYRANSEVTWYGLKK